MRRHLYQDSTDVITEEGRIRQATTLLKIAPSLLLAATYSTRLQKAVNAWACWGFVLSLPMLRYGLQDSVSSSISLGVIIAPLRQSSVSASIRLESRPVSRT